MLMLEFSMTPLGVGESVSPYVARCIRIVEASGLDYRLHAMGTIIEGEIEPVFQVVQQCLLALAEDCPRVSCSIKLDYRAGHTGRIESKVASVARQLGHSPRTA